MQLTAATTVARFESLGMATVADVERSTDQLARLAEADSDSAGTVHG